MVGRVGIIVVGGGKCGRRRKIGTRSTTALEVVEGDRSIVVAKVALFGAFFLLKRGDGVHSDRQLVGGGEIYVDLQCGKNI